MHINRRLGLLLLIPLLFTTAVSAQISAQHDNPQIQSDQRENEIRLHPTHPDARESAIHLDVVVIPKSGGPVAGLQQQDFTILDNKIPQTITSFKAVGGNDEPMEVILLIDDVNTGVENIAFVRSSLDKFLLANGGHLAHPTTLAFLTDSGIKVHDEFSTLGNSLKAALDAYPFGLHTIIRSGIDSGSERYQISVDALVRLANIEASRPGRKIILWISPGWPFLSGARAEEQMDKKQQQQIFDEAVSISALLRQGRITLYSIDPLGSADFDHANGWGEYVKGISKPSQAIYGDLALQVIAEQSGGLTLAGGNDIAEFLRKCLADTQAYYEISFAPSPAKQRDEYHRLEVRTAKPHETARTRQGYYSQP